jgi:hypothetical protein
MPMHQVHEQPRYTAQESVRRGPKDFNEFGIEKAFFSGGPQGRAAIAGHIQLGPAGRR